MEIRSGRYMMRKRCRAGMAGALAVAVALVLAACGDSGDASYDEGFADGHKDGVYNGCFEPESVDSFLEDIEKNATGREGSDTENALGSGEGHVQGFCDV